MAETTRGDVTISALKERKYVKPIEDGLLIPVSVLEDGKYKSGAIDTTDMKEYMGRKLADVFEAKGEGVSTDNIKAGSGITVTANEDGGVTIGCNINHTLYEVVDELPDSGEADKIYVVPSPTTTEQNLKTEYAWISGAWEKIGEFKGEVDLTGYVKESDLNAYAKKTDLPSLDGYATETYVSTNYATKGELPDLTPYAKTTDLPDFDEFAKVDDMPDLTPYAKTTEVESGYVAKETGKGLSKNDYTDADAAAVATIGNLLTKSEAEDTYVAKVTGKGLSKNDYTDEDKALVATITYYAKTADVASNYVAKETGKGLSANDYTDKDKELVDSIPTLAKASAIPTKVSQLTNDVPYLTEHQSLDGLLTADDLTPINNLITALTTRIAALEAKLAHYDARFEYSTDEDGAAVWGKSFLVID